MSLVSNAAIPIALVTLGLSSCHRIAWVDMLRGADTPIIPDGCVAVDGTGVEPYTETGWAREIIHCKTGIEMVFIPAGQFMMGASDTESQFSASEGPRHLVEIATAFYIGKYEVTVEQYKKFMQASGRTNPSFEDYLARLGSVQASWQNVGPLYPAVDLTWWDAKKLSQWGGCGLRLPSEAEWEYACRSGTTTRYCGGDSEDLLVEYGWVCWNSGDETHPVGMLKPNHWGVFDMHGNVWEWCEDVWHEDYVGAPNDGGAWLSCGSEGMRVVRGGSSCDPYYGIFRSAYRLGADVDGLGDCLGSRVVMSVPAAGDHPGLR